jgi:NAD(P)-dependent dehydrogenase (short-subunit alcohol dehydrogenase family)
VSVADQVRELVDSAVEHFGRLDFAANNAGIEGPSVPIQDYPEDGYDQVMAVNLKGVYLCLKEQARKMIDQGHGSIVNTASIAGFIGFPPFSGYVATKHGVMGLTRTAALELAPQGIRVNAVCPGYVLTEMGARSIAAPGTPEFAELTKGIPLGRLGKPEEIGEAICWLCSDRSSLVTGHGLLADGGYVAA